MHIEINHLIALGVFSLLGWFALIWFVGGAICACQAVRRAEAHYRKRFAQADAIVGGLADSARGRISISDPRRHSPGGKA